MSLEAIQYVTSRDFPDDTGDTSVSRMLVRMVAVCIADKVRPGEDGEFYGSLESIAERLGVHRNGVRLAVRHLERVGVLGRSDDPGKRQTNRYLWLPGAASRAAGDPLHPAGIPRDAARGSRVASRADTKRTQVNPTSDATRQADAAAAEAPTLELNGDAALTVNQIAQKMQLRYWAWVEGQTGRAPLSTNPVGFQRMMAHFLGAGIGREALTNAVKALYKRGAPMTRATIEAELDGRTRRPAQRRDQVAEGLAGLDFDANGNLRRP